MLAEDHNECLGMLAGLHRRNENRQAKEEAGDEARARGGGLCNREEDRAYDWLALHDKLFSGKK
jgi:hypothetical protein